MPKPGHRPRRLRKQYFNDERVTVVLRFEDGHEIRVPRGSGRQFDAWEGESIRLLLLYDPDANDREVLATRRAESFDDAIPRGDARRED